MARAWDRFLTAQDRAHIDRLPRNSVGFGQSAAVLLVDNYRWAVGDRPVPILEAIDQWPSSTGAAGWEALGHIEVLLQVARRAGLPIIHVTGLPSEESGVAAWPVRIKRRAPDREPSPRGSAWKYEIVEQAAPLPGEALLRKTAPSAFFGTPLVSHLQSLGVDTLIIGGQTTSGCVRATVVDAASYSYRAIVVEDCVYDRHEAAHAINLFDMNQKYADVLALQEVVDWIGVRRPPTVRTE